MMTLKTRGFRSALASLVKAISCLHVIPRAEKIVKRLQQCHSCLILAQSRCSLLERSYHMEGLHSRLSAKPSCSYPVAPAPQRQTRHQRRHGRQQKAVQPVAALATAAEEAVADPVQTEKSHIQQLLNRCGCVFCYGFNLELLLVAFKPSELASAIWCRPYLPGFRTIIESDTFPKGLDEDVVRAISVKKNEPGWMLDFRLKAFRRWLTMAEPAWSDNTCVRLPLCLTRLFRNSCASSGTASPCSWCC